MRRGAVQLASRRSSGHHLGTKAAARCERAREIAPNAHTHDSLTVSRATRRRQSRRPERLGVVKVKGTRAHVVLRVEAQIEGSGSGAAADGGRRAAADHRARHVVARVRHVGAGGLLHERAAAKAASIVGAVGKVRALKDDERAAIGWPRERGRAAHHTHSVHDEVRERPDCVLCVDAEVERQRQVESLDGGGLKWCGGTAHRLVHKLGGEVVAPEKAPVR